MRAWRTDFTGHNFTGEVNLAYCLRPTSPRRRRAGLADLDPGARMRKPIFYKLAMDNSFVHH